MSNIFAIGNRGEDSLKLKTWLTQNISELKWKEAEIEHFQIEQIQSFYPDILIINDRNGDNKLLSFCNRLKSDNLLKHIPVVVYNNWKKEDQFFDKYQQAGVSAFLSENSGKTESLVLIKSFLKVGSNSNFNKIDSSIEDERFKNSNVKREHYYRAIFENTRAATCIIEENGTISLANLKFAELIGLPLNAVQNKITWMNFVVEEDLKWMQKLHVERRKKNKPVVKEYEFRLVDSKKRIKHVQLFVDLIPGTNKSVVSLIDITDRKIAKQNLEESEKRWQFALEGAGDGVFSWNFKENDLFYSDILESILGVKTKDSNIGIEVWREFIHPDDVDKTLSDFQNYLQGKKPVYINEHRILCRNGNYKWIRVRGKIVSFDENKKPVQMIGTITDITEWKLRERELEIAQYALENANVGIFEIDKRGKVQYANKHANESLGYTREELKKISLFDIDPSIVKETFPPVQNLSENGKFNSIFTTHKRKDGTLFPVDVNFSSFKYHDEYMVFSFVKDISQTVEATIALKENEEKLSSILQSANDAVISADVKGNIISWNNGAVNIFGFSEDEVIGKNITSIMPREYRNNHGSWMKRVAEGGKSKLIGKTLEFQGQHKNGQLFPIELSLAKWKSSKGLFFTAIIRDVTRRKNAEEKLRKGEEKFRSLFQNHAAIKLIVDPESKKIIEANNAAAEFYGWSIQELLSMKMTQINKLPEKELDKKLIEGRKKTGEYFEFKHKRANGVVSDVEVFSSRINIDGKEFIHSIVHDITEKKITERQLKLLSRSVEQSPVSIVITDKNGDIEYVNSVFSKITGYSFEEVIGENPRLLKSGKQPDEVYKKLWNTILENKEWNGELLNKTKNGELFWEDVRISPVVNSQNEVTHFVAIKENITEKKRMFEDLVAAKEKAEESDRLKSAFLANMSHEIRTPMNGILGFADLLKEPQLSGEEKKQFIEIIESSGHRMLNMINDLIDISKIESGMMEVNITEVTIHNQLEYLFRFFQPEASKNGLQLKYTPDIQNINLEIVTDKEKLIAILTNLIKNAIKYTKQGKIEFGFFVKNKRLEFFVQDTGIGISKKYHASIFDRFVQADLRTSRPYEGAGLGLSITKAFVEMLDGEIDLVSEEGKGSRFTFSMPLPEKLIEKDEIRQVPMNELNQDRLLKELTVLITEDDDVGQLFLAALLEDSCKKILFAGNGREAVEMVRAHTEIDLVLMDIKMPVMDGYTATEKIKSLNNEIVVIAQTAFAMTGDREKALAAGCDDYITKPIKKTELFDIILNHVKK